MTSDEDSRGASYDSSYSASADSIVAALATSSKGLALQEADERLRRNGPNALRQRRPVSHWRLFFRQLQSAVVVLLAVAATAAFAFGEVIEGSAIIVVLGVNTFIGFFMELTGVRTMEALMKMGHIQVRVMREGRIRKIPAQHLVLGDIVVVEEGDRIAADMRILEAARLESDEGALTGESLPCSKQVDAVAEGTGLADRKSMLFSGCMVTGGSGKAVVVATGMATELGKITALVEEAKEEVTPLEKRLATLATQLIGVILVITAMIAVFGILNNHPIFLMVEVGIALAVAAIPEGLPVVATIALSRGLLRMARRRGLIRKLSAVETLGSTTIICTDKTGTLTENKMVATRLVHGSGEAERGDDGRWPIDGADEGSAAFPLLRAAALCTNAFWDGAEAHGEPTEAALLVACHEVGIDVTALGTRYPERRREPFESTLKMMATYHDTPGGGTIVTVKGAPEVLFERCLEQEGRGLWQEKNRQLASQGFRVLAFAEKAVSSIDDTPYDNLHFLGLIALYDPPRADVADAIAQCKQAGIRVIMVTGDQAPTALYVAKKLGLIAADENGSVTSADFPHNKEKILASNIVTRVTPKDKLDLITWHQQQGDIVAMTGDGINDAPALKKADIGVAMGQRGTDVAREAAEVILLDDAFQTIVAAVAEGRVIFDNIRDFVRYLLSCNLAEVLVIFLATVANFPLPILPLQILFLNMVTDVFPAMALGVGAGDGKALLRPPRSPREQILTNKIWRGIVIHGLYITAATLAALWLAHRYLGLDERHSVTISFLTLGFAQMWHVFNMRRLNASLIANHIVSNPYIWGALAICTALLAAAIYVPLLSFALHTVSLNTTEWGIVAACSILPVAVDALVRAAWKVAPRS